MKVDAAAFARVFGPREPERRAGTQRLCKTCGGWHMLDAWPHNCRPPDWRPPQRLAAPMIIGDVPEHMPEPGVVIGSRRDQREYMARRGLVEFEDFQETAGTHRQFAAPGTREHREYEVDLVEDIKRAIEEDPLNRPPPKMMEEANAEVDNGEEQVSMEGVEVIKE